MQTSQVFNQRAWPLAGDADDCWVLSALQAVHCVLPWVVLPTVRGFRAAAGDPDDGRSDGGNVAEIMAGLRGTWPQLAGHLEAMRGAGWAFLERIVAEERPVSIATVSGDLPARLRYGFDGLHQVTIVAKNNRIKLANPLAAPHSRWDEVDSLATLKPAIMAYGRLRDGESGAWGVALPTEAEAFTLHPLYRAIDTAALDAEIVALKRRIVAARTALG